MKAIETTATLTENEDDSIETIRAGIYQGWQEVLIGKTRPVSQLWEGIDNG